MSFAKIDEGKKGEELAVGFLKKQGYIILEKNFKARYGEIDIIALDKEILVFIEVKTRSSFKFGTPLESITYWKLRSVIKTAEYYKLTHSKLPEAMRIDAVSVQISSNNEVNIELVKNISQ